jgi:hypothetical protein
MINDIHYSDVVRLGFKTEKVHDKVYFDEYGFNYEIISFKLNRNNVIDWAKESRKCEILVCSDEGDVLERIEIKDLAELEIIIKIFNLIKGK